MLADGGNLARGHDDHRRPAVLAQAGEQARGLQVGQGALALPTHILRAAIEACEERHVAARRAQRGLVVNVLREVGDGARGGGAHLLMRRGAQVQQQLHDAVGAHA